MSERLTAPGTAPVPRDAPHPSLRTESSIGSLQMPAAYANVNGETTSRLALVGVIEEAGRSLRSMSQWFERNAMALKVAGVPLEEIRRARNLLARAIPTLHAVGESVVNNRPQTAPRR